METIDRSLAYKVTAPKDRWRISALK